MYLLPQLLQINIFYFVLGLPAYLIIVPFGVIPLCYFFICLDNPDAYEYYFPHPHTLILSNSHAFCFLVDLPVYLIIVPFGVIPLCFLLFLDNELSIFKT